MRTRACVAASVVEADRFLALSLESQVLYLHCLLSADVTGRILGARRLARGYGLSDALDELVGEGYLIDVDGVVFDRFAWVNNRFNGQHFARMEDCEEYADGRLYFEGIEGKSAYATTLPQLSDNGVTIDCHSYDTRMTVDSTQDNANHYQSQSNGNSPSFSREADEGTEDEDMHPCLCPQCREHATYSMADGQCLIHCDNCGTFLNTR